MKKVVIFGATGSIGVSTLAVLKQHPTRFQVFALTGHNNADLLLKQCLEFHPQYALLQNKLLAKSPQQQLKSAGLKTSVLTDGSDLNYLASSPECDIVMSAIVGSAGLIPTYTAALAGKRILLANKESLVAAGEIITQTAQKNQATIVPVDSEHSAIFQALPFNYPSLTTAGVNKLILTASGGPFLTSSYQELQQATAKQAIAHPNWKMGAKISVDSSTLMNKGLEVIEALWLFKATAEQIEVVIHPQSIIHSMVEYIDHSIIAQLGTPDMKTPIAYALTAPERISSGSQSLNFSQIKNLSFGEPDFVRFPCLKLALASLKSGGSAAAILNASNEIAVAKFLAGRHGFYAIPAMIEKALTHFAGSKATTITEVIALDQEVKSYCQHLLD